RLDPGFSAAHRHARRRPRDDDGVPAGRGRSPSLLHVEGDRSDAGARRPREGVTVRSLTPGFALVAVVGLAAGTCTAPGAGTSIADEQPSRMVTVRDVTARPGIVSGARGHPSTKHLRAV